MSLVERVRDAGMASATVQPGRAVLLGELKRRAGKILPPATLAQLKQENPKRAENEIRAACERVFEEDAWFAEGEVLRRELVSAFIDEVFGLGPLERLVADESITEIMVNASAKLFIERAGHLSEEPNPFPDDASVVALIDRIIGPLGRRIDESSPMVNARLPQGHRVNAVIPPIAPDGPCLTIRKFRAHTITLEEMERSRSVEPEVRTYLEWCVRARRNIAVSGGTGSGKTTLLNALSCKIGDGERIITIEDSLELRFTSHPHVVRLEARPASIEGTGRVSIRDLVVNALRMRPDRIIVGECRGGEALDMLQAMNTGHDGSLTTLHANSPEDCILRLETMVRYAADLPLDAIDAQIGSALNCIVQTARARSGARFVSQICEVDFDRKSRTCRVAPLYERASDDERGEWKEAPAWLAEAGRRGWACEEEVRAWMRSVHIL